MSRRYIKKTRKQGGEGEINPVRAFSPVRVFVAYVAEQ
jgi:hypothetical protein